MHTLLLVFEFLGTTELLVVAVVALLLFGPRKLPEIGRTVGKGLAEFKRASDDFKRTWEYEVELEQRKPALEEGAQAGATAGSVEAGGAADVEETGAPDAWTDAGEPTVARGSSFAESEAGGSDLLADGDAWSIAAPREAEGRIRREAEDEINAS